ncbi:hypothetical protein SAMN02745181_3758 [Rubritalea squalenifaciens DSM 18772]|uniref:Uncharacterized protein n=1 Tax=Rubritalea squalenifaciens DSM 18772 TaxID=1123071 RepID=A0A1M6S978_9BACT|nr:hypothetical protein [Rubritalea squalenifaciens]SHK41313.1 hypothetical protein SAMN02745181_3758 [Rubritalea squalenifaciens DSM 18772]
MINTLMQLPRTKLSYEEGMLVKRGEGDGVVATFPLKEITRIEVEVRREYATPIVLMAGMLGLAWVSLRFIPNEGWSWAACIVCVVFAMMCLLGVETRHITLHTDNGVVSYLINDDYGEAEGFIVSLRTAVCASRGL